MDEPQRIPSTEQQQEALLATWFVLRFLVDPSKRRFSRREIASLSDSALFHQLRDRSWSFRDPQIVALLSDEEKTALAEFDAVFDAMHWRQIKEYPHISELPDDDLSPLVPAGEKLFVLLGAHIRADRP